MWPFSKPKPKVFCEDCKYMKLLDYKNPRLQRNYYNCTHPDLIGKIYDTDGAVHKGDGRLTGIYYEACAYYNSKNDCAFFTPKKKAKS